MITGLRRRCESQRLVVGVVLSVILLLSVATMVDVSGQSRRFGMIWFGFSPTSQEIDLINNYGRNGDLILVAMVPLYGSCPDSRKSRTIAEMFPNMEIMVSFNSIEDMKRCGASLESVSYMALDYEPSSQGERHDPEFTTDQEMTIEHFDEARRVALSFGKELLVSVPYVSSERTTTRQGDWDYGEIATHVDAIIIQMQPFMSDPSLYLENARKVNRQLYFVDTTVIMQTSLTLGSVDENIMIIKQLMKLRNIDGTVVFHKPDQISALEKIVDEIR